MLQDFQVSHHSPGSGTGERLLQPVLLDRSAKSGVTVHRCDCCDAHIGPLALVGGPLDDIVYGARPSGHRDRVVLTQGVPQLLDVRVLGIKRRLRRKHVRLYRGVPSSLEPPLDFPAGDLERIPVGDDDRGTFTEILPEDLWYGVDRTGSNFYLLCVCSLLQGRFDALLTHELPRSQSRCRGGKDLQPLLCSSQPNSSHSSRGTS